MRSALRQQTSSALRQFALTIGEHLQLGLQRHAVVGGELVADAPEPSNTLGEIEVIRRFPEGAVPTAAGS